MNICIVSMSPSSYLGIRKQISKLKAKIEGGIVINRFIVFLKNGFGGIVINRVIVFKKNDFVS
jgi:hypothetical protein